MTGSAQPPGDTNGDEAPAGGPRPKSLEDEAERAADGTDEWPGPDAETSGDRHEPKPDDGEA